MITLFKMSNCTPNNTDLDLEPRLGMGGLVGDSKDVVDGRLKVERSYANASIYAFDCIGGLLGVSMGGYIEDSYAVSIGGRTFSSSTHSSFSVGAFTGSFAST